MSSACVLEQTWAQFAFFICCATADLRFPRWRVQKRELLQSLQQRLSGLSAFLFKRAFMPQGMPAQRRGILHRLHLQESCQRTRTQVHRIDLPDVITLSAPYIRRGPQPGMQILPVGKMHRHAHDAVASLSVERGGLDYSR
ncbi:hypothetical protein GALL_319170 [mine drainage metagenome]|uniref:Uncharacterized protein n=1 Tax=mine drainage metagenome TaxID=410659 RepID=A0A1J5R2F8_9ZZZZ